MPANLHWSGANLDALRAEIFAVHSASEHKTKFWDKEVGPGLALVADHGVYLMGWYKRPALPEGERYPVAYADGLNPARYPDWYDMKIDIMGGDDCADFLPISMFDQVLEAGVDRVTIRMLARSYMLVARRPNTPGKGQ